MARRPKQEITWTPQDRQRIAMECNASILFYGGSAGGGKSDFLLMDYLGGIKHGSKYSGIIFRKTYKQLEQLIKRSKELYGSIGATYTKGELLWTFTTGSTLKFRHLESDDDVEEYQGHEYQYIAFDELTHWGSQYVFDYMLSRSRSAHGVPCYLRAAGNPGGRGHSWVKAMFIDGKEPEHIYTERIEVTPTPANPGGMVDRTIVFIPARLTDNHILMVADPFYEANLKKLPHHLMRALLHGDWDVFTGQVFDEFSRETHVIDPIALRPEWRKFCSMDWGYAKPFSIGWWAVTTEGRMIRYREWYGCAPEKINTGIRMNVKDVAERAFTLSVAEGCREMVADPACWITQGIAEDDTNQITIASYFANAGFNMTKAVNNRINGKMKFHEYLKTKLFDGKPGMLIFKTCLAFIRTIPILTVDPNNPEDIDTKLEDHVYDDARYACMSELASRVIHVPDEWEVHTHYETDKYSALRFGLN